MSNIFITRSIYVWFHSYNLLFPLYITEKEQNEQTHTRIKDASSPPKKKTLHLYNMPNFTKYNLPHDVQSN